MIRKILIFLVLAFVIFWLTWAHFAKGKVISLIKGIESDNIKVVYTDIKISGFPLVWQVQILDPKIILTDQLKSHEFLSKHIFFNFNYKLNEAKLDFDKTIYFRESSKGKSQLYVLNSLGGPLFVYWKFGKPIYLLDDSELLTSLKSIKTNDLDFIVTKEEARIFAISKGAVFLEKTFSEKLENINIKVAGEYKSEKGYFKFQNANLSLDFDFVKNLEMPYEQGTNMGFERLLKITKGEFICGDSSLWFKGRAQFSRSKLPEGEILISMTKYFNLIDAIVPEGFILSNIYLQKLVAKIVSAGAEREAEGDAKFKIKFSEDGVSLGNINLLDIDD